MLRFHKLYRKPITTVLSSFQKYTNVTYSGHSHRSPSIILTIMAVTGKQTGRLFNGRAQTEAAHLKKLLTNQVINIHLSAKGYKVIPLGLHPTVGPLSTNTGNLELSQEWLDYHNDSQEHMSVWL